MSVNTFAPGVIEVTNRPAGTSLRNVARVTGVLYLIIIVTGIFAEFFVRQSLIVPGDATTTAANIMASEGLFRVGIAADLVMIIADVGIGLLFYVLLKQINHALALLAAFFRLAQAATLAINLLNLLFVLQLLSGAEYLAVFEAGHLHALALPFLNAHGIGYAIGLVFFAFSIFILGYLIIKSSYIPRILGVLLLFASLGYLLDSFARVLLPNYGDYQPIFDMAVFMPAFIAELALCLWLLVKGVRIQRQENHAVALPQVQLGAEG